VLQDRIRTYVRRLIWNEKDVFPASWADCFVHFRKGESMKTILGFMVVMSLLSLPLMAQDYPKAEIFGGYQYLHLGNGADINANGWNVSLTGNFNNWFGVAGDFSGAYKNGGRVYSYTGGPVVSLNSAGKVNPFVHALFGGANFGGGGLSSINAFTMMFGGGADVKVDKAFAVRLIQADWVYYRNAGVGESHNVRVSTGLVIRF
jgi:hypothetical protein